ncbi:unnamed protein product, partial [Musa acuminata var. zebrina]
RSEGAREEPSLDSDLYLRVSILIVRPWGRFLGERSFSSSLSFPESGAPFLWETLDAERKPFVSLLPEISICFRRKCYD